MDRSPRELIHDRAGTDRFLVDRAVYVDEEIFGAELRRVFEGTWVYLAHESQLPGPGSFVTAWIGRQPVIVSRSRDGALRGFINACAHRGAALCRSASGQCRTFVCGYHGWSYDLDGKNIGVKDRSTGAYLPAFEAARRDLTPIARLESYRGFVFGSLAAGVPALEEHLGDARVFIDMLVDPAPHGLEVVRGISTYTYEGNWKLVIENSLDGYHFSTVHPTFIRIALGRGRGGKSSQIDAAGTVSGNSGGYDLGRGHGLIWSAIPNPEVLPLFERRAELVARFGEHRADWMIGRLRNLVIYPNLMLLYQVGAQIRALRPLSAGRTEISTYCLAPIGESAAARERRVIQYADFYGASGVGTPDDHAQFNACQVGYAGRAAPLQGYDRGMARSRPGGDEEAERLGIRPVASAGSMADETTLHGQFREWLRLMSPEDAGRDHHAR